MVNQIYVSQNFMQKSLDKFLQMIFYSVFKLMELPVNWKIFNDLQKIMFLFFKFIWFSGESYISI